MPSRTLAFACSLVASGGAVKLDDGNTPLPSKASLIAKGWSDPVDENCWRYEWLPPTLCPQGNDMWSIEDMRASLPEFAKHYAQRPVKSNKGGTNINHAFSLWFTARKLQPKYIIESGVFQGQGTWNLRGAAPDAKIIAIDPEDPTTRKYVDNATTYFIGDTFKDFNDIGWDSLIPLEDRSNTLVVLDDHMHAVRRIKDLMSFSFEHIWFDDNCRACDETKTSKGCGMCDMYSFNMMCAPLPAWQKSSVIEKDDFGKSKRRMPIQEHKANVDFLLSHLDAYMEFPPIYEGCPPWAERADNRSIVGEGGLAGKRELELLGLPGVKDDPYYYGTRHPPYVHLKL